MNTILRLDPMSRTRWNPSNNRDELESRLATLFSGREATGNGGQEALTVTQWSPLVDIMEDEKEYRIKAELPDMKKEDVRLTVEDDVLAISGERKFEKEETSKKYHRVERAYGSFVRSFSLPEDADGSKVTADFKDGMLHVHLPKSVQAKPKAIEIQVG
ncbi:MAG: Hsp20/alpha crystallin family protein [Nitrospira sp.]|nr:Hsp20/alpha crystallin family protein [Nitrospira sp.]MDH4369197.1 Hsp20/alpha crystallin family protein [Nitrospira sp.]